MPHSYSHIAVHTIFSTKDRLPTITADIASDLHAYIGGIVRELGGVALIVNGMPDHVHALVRLPANLSVSDGMRVVKANSPRWMHQKWPAKRKFAWQTGFAAFSVSASNLDSVRRYIEGQEQHHRRLSFQDELIGFLRKHGIAYDERYLWA